MYLIEDNGQATYGNASPSDPYAQWRIKYDPETRTTALINVGSVIIYIQVKVKMV